MCIVVSSNAEIVSQLAPAKRAKMTQMLQALLNGEDFDVKNVEHDLQQMSERERKMPSKAPCANAKPVITPDAAGGWCARS